MPEDLTQIPDPPITPNQDLTLKPDATTYIYILSIDSEPLLYNILILFPSSDLLVLSCLAQSCAKLVILYLKLFRSIQSTLWIKIPNLTIWHLFCLIQDGSSKV